MHLENLKIETNPKYSKEFIQYLPKKYHGQNRINFYSLHDVILLPNERKIVSLELKLNVDENYILQLQSNEDIASSNGIQTIQKTIMSNNKEFINITLWNTTQVKFTVKKGDIISHGYLIPSPITYDIQVVKKI